MRSQDYKKCKVEFADKEQVQYIRVKMEILEQKLADLNAKVKELAYIIGDEEENNK